MTSIARTAPPGTRLALVGAGALALVVAGVYFAIGLGFAPEGFESPPAPVMVLAGVAYLVGGGLILFADRRLLLIGAVVNALVLLLFVASALRGTATIDALSLSGKAAQIALGVLLVWSAREMGSGTDARER
jgi:hypothetical protein